MRGGGPNEEAVIITQNNRTLTNAFLRLYNHAYTLDDQAASELRR